MGSLKARVALPSSRGVFQHSGLKAQVQEQKELGYFHQPLLALNAE
jgi:hypothetical protein